MQIVIVYEYHHVHVGNRHVKFEHSWIRTWQENKFFVDIYNITVWHVIETVLNRSRSVATDGLRSTNHYTPYTIFSMSQRWHESKKVLGRICDKKNIYGFQCLCSPICNTSADSVQLLNCWRHRMAWHCSGLVAYIYICKPLSLIICTWWSWEFLIFLVLRFLLLFSLALLLSTSWIPWAKFGTVPEESKE